MLRPLNIHNRPSEPVTAGPPATEPTWTVRTAPAIVMRTSDVPSSIHMAPSDPIAIHPQHAVYRYLKSNASRFSPWFWMICVMGRPLAKVTVRTAEPMTECGNAEVGCELHEPTTHA